MSVQVGQSLMIGDANTKAYEVPVVKVGLKWLTVDAGYGQMKQYSREEGILNSPYGGWAQTLERYRSQQAEREVTKELRELGVTFESGPKVSPAKRAELLRVMREGEHVA